MMTGLFFLKGVGIGFAIAAPVGPIGVLCIRRSLASGRWIGLVTGLGAATADAMYGCIAGFGLATISKFLIHQRIWLGLLGGIFLCYLGVRTFLSKPGGQTAPARGNDLSSAYLSTLILTLTNPATILSFVAIFAGFGLAASPNYFAAAMLVAGVFAGSALWWLILSSGVSLLHRQISPERMHLINRLSGGVIFAFGLGALFATLRR
jgi:threonine/homoserine/homoserine lactone efflux protein